MKEEGETEKNTKNGDVITKITILATSSSIFNDLLVKENSGGGAYGEY